MKQFDWVRGDTNDALYDIDGPVIVLTIEELREVWDKGYLRGCEEAEAKLISSNSMSGPIPIASQNFTAYLTSKNIQI